MTRSNNNTPPNTPPHQSEESVLEQKIMQFSAAKSNKKNSATEPTNASWKDLLDRNVIIGEIHHNLSPKRFLIENMQLFKDRGYDAIFVEHLVHGDEGLKRFNEDGVIAKGLVENLKKLDVGHLDYFQPKVGKIDYDSDEKLYSESKKNFNFTQIAIAAKKCGIKIIGLEKSEEEWKKYPSGASRMATLNINAKEFIEDEIRIYQEEGKDLKFIALVGSAHLKTCYEVPGICEIIDDVQDLLITDANRYEGNSEKMILDDQTRKIYTNLKLPVEVSMALTWDFNNRMTFEEILKSYEEVQKINQKDGLSSSSSEVELEIQKNPATNPSKTSSAIKKLTKEASSLEDEKEASYQDPHLVKSITKRKRNEQGQER